MTRILGDEPGRLGAERVAGSVRRYVLAAAQASLRAIREGLARLNPERPDVPPTPHPPPASIRTGVETRRRAGGFGEPDPAALLREGATLPDSYGSERLVLIARDPHCLFAYWDISDAHRRSVRERAGGASMRLVVRAYDVSRVEFDARPPSRFQDFAVGSEARSVYAYVGKPAACFVAEIGFLRVDGAFFPLARSQPVWTPRTDQPGSAPGKWMTVGWQERPTPVVAVTPAPPEPQHAVISDAETPFATRLAPSSWPGPLPHAAQRGSWSLVRDDRGSEAPSDQTDPTRNET